MSSNSSEIDPMRGLDVITKMKKELSEIRIGLLEAATDYITTMTELSQDEEMKNDKQKQQSQSSASDTQSAHRDTTEST